MIHYLPMNKKELVIIKIMWRIISIILLPIYFIGSILEGIISFIKYLVKPFFESEHCKYCGGNHWFTKCPMVKR